LQGQPSLPGGQTSPVELVPGPELELELDGSAVALPLDPLPALLLDVVGAVPVVARPVVASLVFGAVIVAVIVADVGDPENDDPLVSSPEPQPVSIATLTRVSALAHTPPIRSNIDAP
jgi:hypothetical protein